MKTSKLIIFALATSTLAVSCAKEASNQVAETTDGRVHLVFSAKGENSTKTVLNGLNVNWSSSEQVSVFALGSTTNNSFTASNVSEDGLTCDLKGEADEAETYYAVSPYSANNTCTADGTLTVTIPSKQAGTANSYDPSAGYMVATSDSTMFSFKHLCCYLKFTSTTGELIKVEFSGNNNEVIAGAGTVTVGDEPAISMASGGSSSIVLTPSSGDTFATGTTYYIAVPAMTFSNGFVLKLLNKDGKIAKRTVSKSITLNRAETRNMGAVDSNVSFEGTKVASVTTIDAADYDKSTGTSARLTGSFTTDNDFDSDLFVCGFEYKESGASEWISLASADYALSFELILATNVLTCDKTYEYRAWAQGTGDAEPVYGETLSFTTFKPFKITVSNSDLCTMVADLPNQRESVSSGTTNAATTIGLTFGDYTINIFGRYGAGKALDVDENIVGLWFNYYETGYGGNGNESNNRAWIQAPALEGKRLESIYVGLGTSATNMLGGETFSNAGGYINIAKAVSSTGYGSGDVSTGANVNKSASKTFHVTAPAKNTSYYLTIKNRRVLVKEFTFTYTY